MPRPGKKRDTGCPFAFALDAFGDRWSLIVVRDLMFRGKRTYGEFLLGEEHVATNVLADRLKDLEAVGIIARTRDADNRRRYLYSLTEKGFDLAPMMLEILRWSAKFDSKTIVTKKIVNRIENDRDGFIADLRARLMGNRPRSGE